MTCRRRQASVELTRPLPAAALALAVVFASGPPGCTASASADSGRSDGGIDAAPADAGLPVSLIEDVAEEVSPLVDPTGASVDRAVGIVVVLVSPAGTEVIGFGAPRIGDGDLPDGSTGFQIGSLTKVFTGLILAALVEEPGSGIEAGDPVNDHLGPGLSAPSFGTEAITLEHLVSHYASLPRMPDNLVGPMFSPASGYTREMLADFLAGYVLPTPPGTGYLYSNLGVGLLGVALAEGTGVSTLEALLLTLTDPLAMGDTGLNEPPFIAVIGERLAQGYVATPGGLAEVGAADMGVLAASGELISTGNDLVLLLRALTEIDPYPGAGAVERAITPVGAAGPPGSEIGYAWNILGTPEGTRQYEKGGVTAGYTAFIAFRREPAVGVAILSNRGNYAALPDATRAVVTMLIESTVM